jgi:murein DD-endopeptidase MepM/ murein hydrolase activator NlpD
LLNAWDGVLRATARVRPDMLNHSATAKRLRRGAVRLTRRVVDLATGHPTIPVATRSVGSRHEARRHVAMARRRSVVRRHLLVRLTSERTVPLAVALTVLLAGAVSLGPSLARPVGAAQGDQQGIRLAIGGGVTGAQYDPAELAGLLGLDTASGLTSEYVDDGTLYKPVAVDTSIQSASDMLRHYTVRSGDTLTGIASRYDVSMMTIWWANHLTAKDQLHVGQRLVIPPVNGLVVTVKAGDTLDTLAAHYKVTADAIVAANELTDTNLIVGEVLVMPGAKGAPIPTPKVTTVAKSSGSRSSSSGTSSYTSGTWHWPVIGGGNYVSQYFWSGHPAVDIAAQYGTPIVAPRGGTVIHAGWSSDGCGYNVKMSIGGGLYLEMCHMSAVRVSVGQAVAKGQQIGNVGQSGWATGPHVHVAVWVGYPWKSSSYRINLLRFF